MRITPAEVQKNIVGLQAERQVVARLLKYEGKILTRVNPLMSGVVQ
jgi:hypothetical protein